MVEIENYSALDLLLSRIYIKLDFQNIYYKPKSKKNGDYILKNISGQFQSGRLSAILGPSGAGKTSLLNILSGFKYSGVKGSIFVNGEKRNCTEFRKISSYIPQQFAILELLTVKETMQVAADLKLKDQVESKNKNEVVYNIIKLLNLEKCSNTLVGRLSGGEKKRLSIGVELVTNPPVMFFDEPTSGLDSVASIQVITHLRQLAHDGRAVICVIHQPSSRLLKLFDDIFVLSEGQCIYNGPLNEMVDHFTKAGFVCPNYYNRADYVLEVASLEHGSDLSNLIANQTKKFDQLNGVSVFDVNEKSDGNQMNHSFKLYGNSFKHRRRKWVFNFLHDFGILVKRSFLCMSRNLLCVQLRILFHILVAVLFGVVFWKIGADAAKILSNTSCLFFFILFIFFANSFPTIVSCPLETAVFVREHLNGWYSVKAYFLSKLIADIPLEFICPTLFCAIAYYMTGQPEEFGRYLMVWGMCLLTTINGHSMGLVTGSTFSLEISLFFLPALCIPMLLFSGFFIRYHELSVYFRPFTHISYFRYSLEGLVQSIYAYNRTNLICSEPFCYYMTPGKFLQDFDMDGDRYGMDVAALTIWIIFLQISLYCSLLYKIRKAQ